MIQALKELVREYGKVNSNVRRLIVAVFFIQLVNAVYFLIANIYLSKKGFSDPEIAGFLSARYLMILILALPFGLFIKGRKLLPFFRLSSISVPICSLILIYAIESGQNTLVYTFFGLLGIAFMMSRISMMPFILRNVDESAHSEAITLNFINWSSGTIIIGFLVAGLTALSPEFFDERRLILWVSILSFFSVLMIIRIGKNEVEPPDKPSLDLRLYDWRAILEAVIPTLIIAVGAGLTIPFLNLFFYKTFGMDSDEFALLGSITSILVVLTALMIPRIKRRFGYKSIPVTQFLSVLALIGLATTELFSSFDYMIYIAIIFYMLRQPLMNIANPMTSELTMYYVGERNREMLSAILASVWSGSWFFSAQLVRLLRQQDYSFGRIFYFTAGLYIVGIISYIVLISMYGKANTPKH